MISNIRKNWEKIWIKLSGIRGFGKAGSWIAALFSRTYHGRTYLAWVSKKGFTSAKAIINHRCLNLAENVFIDDNVLIFQFAEGGEIRIGNGSSLYRDCIVQTGRKGCIIIGENSHIQARCIFSAFVSNIIIGSNVQIAPNCSFFSYDHGTNLGLPIIDQPLTTKGGIVIGDDVWIGVGAIVLDGVLLGRGSVVGAGSVVTKNIPDYSVAVGNPARVVKMRSK
jgi:acetyltransferase-like isoleucine patch superfamily enzyme